MRLAERGRAGIAAGHRLGFRDNFLEVLDRERRYTAAQRKWEQYYDLAASSATRRAARSRPNTATTASTGCTWCG